EVENKIVKIIETDQSKYVGKLIASKFCIFYIYLERDLQFKKEINQLIEEEKDFAFEMVWEDDPDWDFYLDMVKDPEEILEAENELLLNELLRNGDNSVIKRPVRHWIYFATAGGREEFLKQVQLLNYTLISMDEIEDKFEFGYKLCIEREDRLTLKI